jgi:hypothetical protein
MGSCEGFSRRDWMRYTGVVAAGWWSMGAGSQLAAAADGLLNLRTRNLLLVRWSNI